jgi:transcriptional regulator with XRE-family HTH domain
VNALGLAGFGREVAARREALGLSLRELARRLDLSPGYMSDIEHGRRAPSDDTLEGLLHALECARERERWLALCGRLPGDLFELLVAHPERWGEVRAVLRAEPSGR